jgi:polyhydroxyalkanoate synthesis regulator phasin
MNFRAIIVPNRSYVSVKKIIVIVCIGILLIVSGCGEDNTEYAKDFTKKAINIVDKANTDIAPDIETDIEELTTEMGGGNLNTPKKINEKMVKLESSVITLKEEYEKAKKYYEDVQDLKGDKIINYRANAKNSISYLKIINDTNSKVVDFFYDFIDSLAISDTPLDPAQVKDKMTKNIEEMQDYLEPFMKKAEEFRKTIEKFEKQI